jgi:hypothetical protein
MVSLSTLGVVEYFHVLQCSFRVSFLGFRDEASSHRQEDLHGM